MPARRGRAPASHNSAARAAEECSVEMALSSSASSVRRLGGGPCTSTGQPSLPECGACRAAGARRLPGAQPSCSELAPTCLECAPRDKTKAEQERVEFAQGSLRHGLPLLPLPAPSRLLRQLLCHRPCRRPCRRLCCRLCCGSCCRCRCRCWRRCWCCLVWCLRSGSLFRERPCQLCRLQQFCWADSSRELQGRLAQQGGGLPLHYHNGNTCQEGMENSQGRQAYISTAQLCALRWVAAPGPPGPLTILRQALECREGQQQGRLQGLIHKSPPACRTAAALTQQGAAVLQAAHGCAQAARQEELAHQGAAWNGGAGGSHGPERSGQRGGGVPYGARGCGSRHMHCRRHSGQDRLPRFLLAWDRQGCGR